MYVYFSSKSEQNSSLSYVPKASLKTTYDTIDATVMVKKSIPVVVKKMPSSGLDDSIDSTSLPSQSSAKDVKTYVYVPKHKKVIVPKSVVETVYVATPVIPTSDDSLMSKYWPILVTV